jgi:hypothetical protein
MSQIRFYRQERYDGGLRTGFGIDNQPALEEFQAGQGESDPALLWYVDLELDGKSLPHDVERARVWALDHAEPIIAGLRLAAERLEIGLDDTTDWPYRLRVQNLPRGIRGELRISAVRGLGEGELAGRLAALADDWSGVVQRLAPMVHV